VESFSVGRAKLSDTQKEALKITRTFSKALNTYAEKREESLKVVRSSVRMEDTYNKKLTKTLRTTRSLSRVLSGFSAMSRVVAGASDVMGALVVDIDRASASLGSAVSDATAFSSVLEGIGTSGEQAISKVRDLSREVEGLAFQRIKLEFDIADLPTALVTEGLEVPLSWKTPLPPLPAMPPTKLDVEVEKTEIPVEWKTSPPPSVTVDVEVGKVEVPSVTVDAEVGKVEVPSVPPVVVDAKIGDVESPSVPPATVDVKARETEVSVKPKPATVDVKARETEVPVKPEPRALDVKAEPTEVSVKPEPATVDVKAEPTEVPVKPEPGVLDVKAEPTGVLVKPEPGVLDVKARETEVPVKPATVDVKAEPAEVPVKPEPRALDVKAEPTEVPVKPEPATVDVKAEPTEVPVKPEPATVDVKAEPTEVSVKPEPATIDVKARETEVQVKPEPATVDVEATAEPPQLPPGVLDVKAEVEVPSLSPVVLKVKTGDVEIPVKWKTPVPPLPSVPDVKVGVQWDESSFDVTGALSRVRDLSREVEGLAAHKVTLGVDIANLPTALVTKGVEVPLKWKTPLPPIPDMPVAEVDIQWQSVKPPELPAPSTLSGAAEAMGDMGEQARGAASSVRELASSSDTLSGEIERATRLVDLASAKLQEGADEARRFGGGIDASSGAMVAGGVAAAFLFSKLGGLADAYQDAAKSLSSFNVQAGVFGATIAGSDLGQLSALRRELNLTKEQSLSFYETIKAGSESGVVSMSELTGAAIKLRGAFGGDPTEKLKEFIELVETVPTLEADLSVTASLDDRAASLFALAKAGKISTLIELQSAGLLGGVDVSIVNPEDVKMLNAQQKSVKTQEDIKDFLVGEMFPTWGSHLSVISKTMSGLLAAAGGMLAFFGGLKMLSARQGSAQIVATKRVEAAIYATAGKRGMGGEQRTISTLKKLWMGRGRITRATRGGGVKGGLQSVLRVLGKDRSASILKRGGIGALVKSVPKVGKAMSMFPKTMGAIAFSAGKVATAFKVLTGPIGWVAAALGVAGIAAKKFSRSLTESGNELGGAITGVAGETIGALGTIAAFAAGGAVIASVLPGIGTAVGGVAGALVGLGTVLYSSTDTIGESIESLGGMMQGEGYSEFAQRLGRNFEAAGSFVKEFGAAFREQAKVVFNAIGKFAVVGTLPGQIYLAGKALVRAGKTALENVLYTKKEIAIRRRVASTLKEFDAALKEAIKPNEALSEAQRRAQKQSQASALALQRQINAIAKAADNAKTQLYSLEKEVAGLDLTFFRESGGTMEQFNRAIDRSTRATVYKFRVLNDGLTERRAEIARDSSLTNEERRAALADLHEKEISAAQEFVSAMGNIVDELLRTPEIIASQLRAEGAGQITEFAGQTGALGIDEFTGTLEREVENGASALDGLFDQLGRVEATIAERENEIARQAKSAREELSQVFSELPDVVKKRFKDAKIDIENLSVDNLETVLENTGAGIDDINKTIERLSGGLTIIEDGGATGLSQRGAAIAARLKKAEEELQDAAESARRGEGWVEKEVDARQRQKLAAETVSARQKEIAELRLEQGNLEEKIGRWAREQGASSAAVKLLQKNFLKEEEEAVKILRKNGDAGEEAVQLLRDYKSKEAEATRALNERTDLLEKQKGLSRANAAAEGLINAEYKLENAILTERNKVQAEILRQTSAVIASIQKVNSNAIAEVKQAQRRADLIAAESEIAAVTGRGLENIERQNAANIAVQQATVESVDKQVQMLQEKKKKYEEELRTATDPLRIDTLRGLIEAVDDKTNELKITAKEAEMRVYAIFDGLDSAIEAAMKGPEGKVAQYELDLSGVQFELAEFSEAAEGMLGNSVEMAQQAARTRARIEREAIARQLREAEKAAQALALQGRGEEAKERLRAAQVEAQLKLERSKTDEVRTQLDAVKKAADIEMNRVSIIGDGLSAELDYLGFIGAHYSRMLDIQGDMVTLARERYDIAQRELEATRQTGATGQELLRKETEVRKAWFDLQKKSVGVQKDVIEKILGAAFGKLRSMGAATGIERVSARRGVAGTRVYTAAGMPMAAGKEGVTLAERAILRQLRGLGGQAPRKLSAEERLEKAMRGTEGATMETAENTEDTANATVNLNRRGSRAGSIFTHDKGAHGILESILAVTKEIAIALINSSEEAKEANKTQSKDGDKPTERVADRIEKVIKAAAAKSNAASVKHQDELDRMVGMVAASVKSAKSDRSGEQIIDLLDNSRSELQASVKELRRLQNLSPEEAKKYDNLEQAIKELKAKINEQSQKVIGYGSELRRQVMENPFAGGGFHPTRAHLDILAGKVPTEVRDAVAALEGLKGAASSAGDALNGYRGNLISQERQQKVGTPRTKEEIRFRAQAVVYKTQRGRKDWKDSAEMLIQASREAGRLRESFEEWQFALNKETAQRKDEIHKWRDDTVLAMWPHAQSFGGGDKVKTDKAFREMEEGIWAEAEKRKTKLGAWHENMLDKQLRNEAEYQRKSLGLYTQEEKKQREAFNLQKAVLAVRGGVTVDNRKRQSLLDDMAARTKLAGPEEGPSVTLEGKGLISRLARTKGDIETTLGGALAAFMAAKEARKSAESTERVTKLGRARDRGVTGGYKFTGSEAGGIPVGGAIAVSGVEATRQEIAARQKIPGGDEGAFSTKPSLAYSAPSGEAATGGGASAMRITGDLRIISNDPTLNGTFAEMVARVINTPEVRNSLKRTNVLISEA